MCAGGALLGSDRAKAPAPARGSCMWGSVLRRFILCFRFFNIVAWKWSKYLEQCLAFCLSGIDMYYLKLMYRFTFIELIHVFVFNQQTNLKACSQFNGHHIKIFICSKKRDKIEKITMNTRRFSVFLEKISWVPWSVERSNTYGTCTFSLCVSSFHLFFVFGLFQHSCL